MSKIASLSCRSDSSALSEINRDLQQCIDSIVQSKDWTLDSQTAGGRLHEEEDKAYRSNLIEPSEEICLYTLKCSCCCHTELKMSALNQTAFHVELGVESAGEDFILENRQQEKIDSQDSTFGLLEVLKAVDHLNSECPQRFFLFIRCISKQYLWRHWRGWNLNLPSRTVKACFRTCRHCQTAL